MKGVALGLALGLAHHVVGLARVAPVAQRFEAPDAFLLGSVGIQKVFVEHALAVFPGALHYHGKALDHRARAVGEHAIGVERAVEILLQIEHRFFTAVAVEVLAGAAT